MKRRLSQTDFKAKQQGAAKRRADRQLATQLGFLSPIVGGQRARAPANLRITRQLNSQNTLPEMKWIDRAGDITFDGVAANNAAVGVPINWLQRGTATWNRIGRKVNWKTMEVHCCLTVNDGPVGTWPVLPRSVGAHNLRVAVIYDKEPTGTVPNYNTIFDNRSNLGVTTSSVMAMPNGDEKERFVILRDKIVYVPQCEFAANAAGALNQLEGLDDNVGLNAAFFPKDEEGRDASSWHWYINLANLISTFSGDSAAVSIGDFAAGAIYIVTFASYAAGAAGEPERYPLNFRFGTRLTFAE